MRIKMSLFALLSAFGLGLASMASASPRAACCSCECCAVNSCDCCSTGVCVCESCACLESCECGCE